MGVSERIFSVCLQTRGHAGTMPSTVPVREDHRVHVSGSQGARVRVTECACWDHRVHVLPLLLVAVVYRFCANRRVQPTVRVRVRALFDLTKRRLLWPCYLYCRFQRGPQNRHRIHWHPWVRPVLPQP